MDRCRAGVADEAGGFRTPLPTLIAISTGSPPSLRMPCGWLTLFSTVSLGPNRASITSSPRAQPTGRRVSRYAAMRDGRRDEQLRLGKN